MLVISRKPGESFKIGPIECYVVASGRKNVRLRVGAAEISIGQKTTILGKGVRLFVGRNSKSCRASLVIDAPGEVVSR